jgi:hypothetical protein
MTKSLVTHQVGIAVCNSVLLRTSSICIPVYRTIVQSATLCTQLLLVNVKRSLSCRLLAYHGMQCLLEATAVFAMHFYTVRSVIIDKNSTHELMLLYAIAYTMCVQTPTLLSAATAWQGYKTAATATPTAPVTVTPVTPAAETITAPTVPAATTSSTAATKAAAVSRAKTAATASTGSSTSPGFAVDTSALTQQVTLYNCFLVQSFHFSQHCRTCSEHSAVFWLLLYLISNACKAQC